MSHRPVEHIDNPVLLRQILSTSDFLSLTVRTLDFYRGIPLLSRL